MSINNSYSLLARTVKTINNPSLPVGTLIEEIPTDIGRAHEGYKRGGTLEGLEKLRKEFMSALVWMFGIPVFNKLGNKFCENVLKILTEVDFSNAAKGNSAIEDSVQFLTTGTFNNEDYSDLLEFGDKFLIEDTKKSGLIDKFKQLFKKQNNDIKIANAKEALSEFQKTKDINIEEGVEFLTKGKLKNGLDVSNLMRYGDKFLNKNTKKLIHQTAATKQITSISAIILNCLMMGFFIPKINQAMTNKKINQEKNKTNTAINSNFVSFEEFQNNTKKSSNDLSFKGEIKGTALENMTYQAENNSRFRLIITDIPMIIGRMMTSRNKYEALEYLVMDGTSVYFYNFSSEHIQKLLRKAFGNIPDIQPTTIEALTKNQDAFKDGYEKFKNNPEIFKLNEGQKPDEILKNIFGKSLAEEIYKDATFSKYGKINKFLKNSTIEDINNNVKNYIQYLEKQATNNNPLFKNGVLNQDLIKNTARKVKNLNTGFLGIGLFVSIIGLSVIIPKLTFAITKQITGKNEFVALLDDTEEKDKEK